MTEKKRFRLAVCPGAFVIDTELPEGMEPRFQDKVLSETIALATRSTMGEAAELLAEKKAIAHFLSPRTHRVELDKARAVVRWFETNPARFRAWFAEWAKAPDRTSMRYLLWAAEEMGVTQDARSRADTKHAKNRELGWKVEEMWTDLKAQGKTKNEAAPIIAKSVPLALTTIRKRLQGL
jgi:hypothetical protein